MFDAPGRRAASAQLVRSGENLFHGFGRRGIRALAAEFYGFIDLRPRSRDDGVVLSLRQAVFSHHASLHRGDAIARAQRIEFTLRPVAFGVAHEVTGKARSLDLDK